VKRLCLTAALLLALVPFLFADPYFTGSGGEGLSITVLAPEGTNLDAADSYLPAFVQSILSGDFTKFSKISVLDWQSLEKVLAETMNLAYEDTDEVIRLGHLTHTQYILLGELVKTGAGYSLHLRVTDTKTGANRASHMANCTKDALEDMSGVKQASVDLLEQLGVALNAAGKAALLAVTPKAASAETAMAKGVTAARNGTVVEAMSYYYQAQAFDPALLEASNRLSVMSSHIASGTTGETARNDIQRRKEWLQLLTECAEYFKNRSVLNMSYDPTLEYGKVDYKTESMDISFKALIQWDNAAYSILYDLRKGLNATGKIKDWGLGDWPLRVNDARDTEVFGDKKSTNKYVITAGLSNDEGKLIGTAQCEFRYRVGDSPLGIGSFDAPLLPAMKIPDNKTEPWTVTFKGVKANDITDTLTVSIRSVNGISVEEAGRTGYTHITTENLSEYKYFFSGTGGYYYLGKTIGDFVFAPAAHNGLTVMKYKPSTGKGPSVIAIPGYVNAMPVMAIGPYARIEGNGDQPRLGTRRCTLIIPDTVEYLDIDAIGNGITDVVFSNNLLFIRDMHVGTLINQYLQEVTVPANMSDSNLEKLRSGFGFSVDVYVANGRKRGTYVHQPETRGPWQLKP
jgi:hypothetical protein